jgi:hypothetical protein
MEKKELPNKKEENLPAKIPGLSAKAFGVIKFILGICFLPLVYAITVAFLNEFSGTEKAMQNYFWSGAITLLLIYLFVWEPAIIYARGQKLTEIIFAFFKPLVRVAPYLLPVYSIILFFLYWILSYSFKDALAYFLFFFGLTTALHLVFSAKTMRAKQGDFLKANYIFGFALIYIINLVLVALLMNFIFPKFSLVNFSNNSFQAAKDIFTALFRQLFVTRQ